MEFIPREREAAMSRPWWNFWGASPAESEGPQAGGDEQTAGAGSSSTVAPTKQTEAAAVPAASAPKATPVGKSPTLIAAHALQFSLTPEDVGVLENPEFHRLVQAVGSWGKIDSLELKQRQINDASRANALDLNTLNQQSGGSPIGGYVAAMALAFNGLNTESQRCLSECKQQPAGMWLADLTLRQPANADWNPFLFPAFDPDVDVTIPKAIQQVLAKALILVTRRGALPVATLFQLDTANELSAADLANCRIDCLTIMSSVTSPQVVAVNYCLHDNPRDPYRMEVLTLPFGREDAESRFALELFVRQAWFDYVLVDGTGRVKFHRPLQHCPIQAEANGQLAAFFERNPESTVISPENRRSSVQEHTRRFNPVTLDYSRGTTTRPALPTQPQSAASRGAARPALPSQNSPKTPVSVKVPATVAPVVPTPPTTLDGQMLKPYAAAGLSPAKLSCDSSPVELKVKGDVTHLDFDYRQGVMIAQHDIKSFGDWSAWKFGTWEPTLNDWRLDLSLVGTHQLAKSLGKNLEITSRIVRTMHAAHGRYLHIQVNEPVRAFDFNQKEIHLIWDVERRTWLSGVVVGFLAFPTYWAGAGHLAMEQGRQVLRIMPIGESFSNDLTAAPFSLNTLCWDLHFGPDDAYVVSSGGPTYSKGVQERPLSIAGYNPRSIQAVWERSYTTLPAIPDGANWTILKMELTSRHELLGIVKVDEGSTTRYQMYDLVAGVPVGLPVSTATKEIGYHGAVSKRRLVAYAREPNILEVIQLGRPDPVILSVALPDKQTSPVSCYLCSEGNYLAVLYKTEGVIRVYTFVDALQTDAPQPDLPPVQVVPVPVPSPVFEVEPAAAAIVVAASVAEIVPAPTEERMPDLPKDHGVKKRNPLDDSVFG